MSSHDPPANNLPSDIELMLWVDGELDEQRAAEVQTFVERDHRARAIVAGLQHAATLVTSEVLQDAELRGADAIADRVMGAIETGASHRVIVPARRAPGWRAAAVTAIGAAVAIAASWIFFVRNMPIIPANQTTAAVLKAPRGSGESFAAPESTAIEVVDFGARPGTIFYVPSEGESALAVVWLTDDDTSPSGDGL